MFCHNLYPLFVEMHKRLCAICGFSRKWEIMFYEFMKAIDFLSPLRYNILRNLHKP